VSLFGLGSRRLRWRILIVKGTDRWEPISCALFLGHDGERQSSDIDADSKYWGGHPVFFGLPQDRFKYGGSGDMF
jgi:hypothetical protein